MHHPRLSVIVLACVAAIAVPGLGVAQESSPRTAFLPSLGDLMTVTVQPRHTKLGLAGREKNWAYADYEFRELKEAFDRVERTAPLWRSQPVGEMMRTLTEAPLTALGAAIQAGDAGRYETAYRQLTEACNSCHQAVGRGMIVVRAPEGSPFPDQDFRPTTP